MINKIHHQDKLSFKAAQLNILATSDNHGNSHSVPLLAETIRYNKKDIFVKSEEKSTLNIFAIAGDWFINPSKKGYRTMPTLTNGDIQNKFLNKLVDYVKNLSGENSNFDAVFAMGNHDFDGGDKFMYRVMKNKNKKFLVTNVDIENSPGIKQLQEENSNVKESIIYEIEDDKNPDLKHKVLFLGITIPSMKFYNPGLLKKMSFYDDCNKKDSNLKAEDIENTIKVVKEHVDAFKKENPKGAVVLLSHMGGTISKLIRDEVPQINIILNGHDHKNTTSLKGKTNINSLGKDNELVKSLNLRFDDNGDIETIDMNSFFSKTTEKDNLPQNPLQQFLEKAFHEDTKPVVSLTTVTGQPTELEYGELVRYQNSHLANYLTSAVKRSVRKVTHNEEVIVGIPSSIIRGGLKNGSSNLDIMKIFDGVSEDLSEVYIGTIKGSELVGLITENVQDNLKAPSRNTIIQWSDIQVNRTLINDITNGNSNKNFKDAVKVRAEGSHDFKNIDENDLYTIAIAEKYLIKDDIEWPQKIRRRFISLGKTYDEMFRDYIASDEINFQLKSTDKTKEKRII